MSFTLALLTALPVFPLTAPLPPTMPPSQLLSLPLCPLTIPLPPTLPPHSPSPFHSVPFTAPLPPTLPLTAPLPLPLPPSQLLPSSYAHLAVGPSLPKTCALSFLTTPLPTNTASPSNLLHWPLWHEPLTSASTLTSSPTFRSSRGRRGEAKRCPSYQLGATLAHTVDALTDKVSVRKK